MTSQEAYKKAEKYLSLSEEIQMDLDIMKNEFSYYIRGTGYGAMNLSLSPLSGNYVELFDDAQKNWRDHYQKIVAQCEKEIEIAESSLYKLRYLSQQWYERGLELLNKESENISFLDLWSE